MTRRAKRRAGVVNYVRENLTAIKNLAEYLISGELSSGDDLKKGQGGILRSGLSKIAVCRDVRARSMRTRRSVHIWDASCTGIRRNSAGTAPAMGRNSHRTEPL